MLLVAAQSFPTPMEEPKKVLRADYLGCVQVTRAAGMDVVNDAIEQAMNTTPVDQWRAVTVAVAPSMITIIQDDVSQCLLQLDYMHNKISKTTENIELKF